MIGNQTAAPTRAMSRARQVTFLGIWLFPYFLAALAYLGGHFTETGAPLRAPLFSWPIPQDVYGWLLAMVLLSGVWLLGEFISVTSRETVIAALQWDAVVSTLNAIFFSGLVGYYVGVGDLQWWIVVPWLATVIDAMMACWLGLNNAAQKPFLSPRGTM